MQKTTFLLILIAALGIGSSLYLLGGTASVSADPIVYSYPRKVSSPFQQHVEEGLENSSTLRDYFKKLDEISLRDQKLTQSLTAYQAHVDGYFQEAEAEAELIQDSTLKAVVLEQLAVELDSMTARTAELKKKQVEMRSLAARAEDLGRVMRVLTSFGPLSKWAKENHPAIPGLEQLSSDYRKLLDDFRAKTSAI